MCFNRTLQSRTIPVGQAKSERATDLNKKFDREKRCSGGPFRTREPTSTLQRLRLCACIHIQGDAQRPVSFRRFFFWRGKERSKDNTSRLVLRRTTTTTTKQLRNDGTGLFVAPGHVLGGQRRAIVHDRLRPSIGLVLDQNIHKLIR
jgi:hypothetical protein